MNPKIHMEKFALSDTQANRLNRYSNYSGVSKSETLRRALNYYLELHGYEAEPTEVLKIP